VLALQSDVVQATCSPKKSVSAGEDLSYDALTFLVVGVHLEGAHSGVFGLAAGVDALLFVHQEPLVAGEVEGFVVATALAAVQLQSGGGTVATDAGHVPLTVVHGDGAQPDVLLLGAKRVQIVPE
jgi:hypothetical protein